MVFSPDGQGLHVEQSEGDDGKQNIELVLGHRNRGSGSVENRGSDPLNMIYDAHTSIVVETIVSMIVFVNTTEIVRVLPRICPWLCIDLYSLVDHNPLARDAGTGVELILPSPARL